MSKFARYEEYPEKGLAKAMSALLTVWPGLSRYHDDLVLVGGLAVHCLTSEKPGGYPVAVTIDADLGIALAAGGEMYGTIANDLTGLGFKRDEVNPSRYYREVEGVKVYLDFLTEAPGAKSGSQMVDDIVASVIPGINRALANRRKIRIVGKDLYGVEQSILVNVGSIGPLLVLKLNAFGGPMGRRQPKDAYDLLLLVTSYIDGYEAAIAGFRDEATEGNPAYAGAVEALRRDFFEAEFDGPVRAADFLTGTVEEVNRIRQDMVTAARALLGDPEMFG